jgi:hypothetical protein
VRKIVAVTKNADLARRFPAATVSCDRGEHSLNNVLKYVRAGSGAQPAQAWKIAVNGLQVPADKTQASNASYVAALNVGTERLFSRLFLDAADARGDITPDPTPDETVTPLIVAQLHDNLTNGDGLRTFATRRLAVDVLKHMQVQAALDALVDARAKISTKGLSGSALNDTNDLLARIDAALTPYFN